MEIFFSKNSRISFFTNMSRTVCWNCLMTSRFLFGLNFNLESKLANQKYVTSKVLIKDPVPNLKFVVTLSLVFLVATPCPKSSISNFKVRRLANMVDNTQPHSRLISPPIFWPMARPKIWTTQSSIQCSGCHIGYCSISLVFAYQMGTTILSPWLSV